MKTLSLLGLVTLLPFAVDAQVADDLVARALAAVPERSRPATTVVRWNADYTYQTLQDGSGPMVCYDRSDEPRRRPFAVLCTSRANLERMAQNRRFRMESADGPAEQAMVAEAEANGTRIAPEYGSIWIHMDGDDMASARIHTTIAVPGATVASLGLPDNARAGGAWLMAGGTTSAHIMVPGR